MGFKVHISLHYQKSIKWFVTISVSILLDIHKQSEELMVLFDADLRQKYIRNSRS